jgi:hypothetical protein
VDADGSLTWGQGSIAAHCVHVNSLAGAEATRQAARGAGEGQ